MTRIENHVLIPVLDGVEFLYHLVVAIIESDEGNDFSTCLFEVSMGFDILQHRLSDGPRPIFDPLFLPHPVELLDYLVWDVKTRSHGY